jgi:hypothetical protein
VLRLIPDAPLIREMSVAEQGYRAVVAVISDGRTVSEVAASWEVSVRGQAGVGGCLADALGSTALITPTCARRRVLEYVVPRGRLPGRNLKANA